MSLPSQAALFDLGQIKQDPLCFHKFINFIKVNEKFSGGMNNTTYFPVYSNTASTVIKLKS